LDEDELLVRPEAMEDVDDLDGEALGLGAAEDGEPIALHAGADLFDAEDRGRRARRVGGAPAGEQQEREAKPSPPWVNAEHPSMLSTAPRRALPTLTDVESFRRGAGRCASR